MQIRERPKDILVVKLLLIFPMTPLSCVGVVADMTWRRLNYEFVFLARTTLSFRKVMERARTAKSASEHCQLESFLWNPYFLRELLLADPEGFVPTGFGGIALCLRREFGSVVVPEWIPTHRTYTEHMGRRL